jgi:hypothetical protein
MNFHPPAPEIPPDTPFENDLLGRKQFGDSLRSVLSDAEMSTVLCIDAPWGQGKTTFAKMWIADLKHLGKKCIYFDAYEHDHSEDPFLAFCAEIITLAESEFPNSPDVRDRKKQFRDTAKKVGARLLVSGAGIAAKAATFGLLGQAEINGLKGVTDDIADASSSVASKLMDKALDNYIKSRDALVEFRDKLARLGASVRETQGFPLVIVVDELDRCRPSFALSLIERIKHLFSADNVHFVLLANVAQLESCVRAVYGQDVDARTYLQKFFTVRVELPLRGSNGGLDDYGRYARHLVSHYSAGSLSGLEAVPLFRFYRFSLREMEQFILMLALLGRSQVHPEFLHFLIVLRLRFPELFEGIRTGRADHSTILEQTRLLSMDDGDRHSITGAVLSEQLAYYLLSEQELQSLPQEHWAHLQLAKDQRFLSYRRIAASQTCEDLLRFSVMEQ